MRTLCIIFRITWPLVLAGCGVLGLRAQRFFVSAAQPSFSELSALLTCATLYQIFHINQLRKKGFL